jgi:hypothetical protein
MEVRPVYPRSLSCAIVAAVAWLGLGIQFYVTQTHPNLQNISPVERTVRYLEYFTILTNLIVALTTTVSLIAPVTWLGRFSAKPSVRTAVAVYIAFVGLVYNIVLQGLNEFSGLALVADVLTHDLVPILYVIFWLTETGKSELNLKMPFAWAIYPLAYALFAVARGGSTGRYPYPFLDAGRLGLGQVFLNSVGLAIAFFLLGEILVIAGKSFERFVLSRRPRSVA